MAGVISDEGERVREGQEDQTNDDTLGVCGEKLQLSRASTPCQLRFHVRFGPTSRGFVGALGFDGIKRYPVGTKIIELSLHFSTSQ